jgi:8-oxo-dGTP pyrophosphatase MutT (NUDIX family)
MPPCTGSKLREGAAAILIDMDGRLLMQLRDNIPYIRDPGKISLFGGGREGNESFLECIVREIHEETRYYLPPVRFEWIARWSGPDYMVAGGTFRGELFLVREVPVEKLTITEGTLKVVGVDELEHIRHSLAPLAQFAVKALLKSHPQILAITNRNDQ